MTEPTLEQLQAELARIDAALAELGETPSPVLQTVREDYQARREELASQIETARLEQRTVTSGNGGLAIGGDQKGPIRIINGNQILVFADAMQARSLLKQLLDEPPQADLEQATARYLENLVDRYRYLDFKGMGVSDRVPLKLPLLQMYVPLKGRREMPDGDTWDRAALRLAGRAPSEDEAEAMGSRLSEPQPLLELIAANDGLIVLGDPGAGKTTFLKYLALTLATGQGKTMGLEPRLPILLPLSGYANALEQGDLPLDEYIVQFYRDRGIDLPVGGLLEQALASGGVLLLLDGLDEVKQLERRHTVVTRVVEFFSYHRRAGNKFVITSRIVGYPEVRPRVEGLAECTLVDFDEEEVEAFIDQWTIALEQAARGVNPVAEEEAESEKRELLEAVRHNPGVRALAANPLLLTILALMKRQGISLPEKRVELYEKYVDTLLYHWNLARSLDGRGGHSLDVRDTLKILAPLALWMHRTSPGVGLVKEVGLRDELERIYSGRGAKAPEEAADAFLDDLRRHSGLLLDRGARQYGFIHLTFQEYLAAVALAQKGQQGVGEIIEEIAAHLEDDNWHEVSLLALGYLAIIQQRDEAAGTVLQGLLERFQGIGESAILAGEALLDIGRDSVPPLIVDEIDQALLRTLGDDRRIESKRRAEAGRVLGRLGDPRPEVTQLDAMQFCWVPPGPFMLGEGDKAQEYDIEYPYWISRWPVTVAQFRAYVTASGQQSEDDDALRDPDNYPLRWISWHEALAFCRWLTDHWREAGRIPDGWSVILPSEVEWEKAARGGLMVPKQPMIKNVGDLSGEVDLIDNSNPSRTYPWGEEINGNRANHHGNIGETSAIGCFPHNLSPLGCEELSGNLWERTRSLYGEYPYPPGKFGEARECLHAKGLRVARGGAFFNPPGIVRCVYRLMLGSTSRHVVCGFRLVVSPFSDL
jgi:formylglycine-generating enzyme required for sulfatase activity